MGCCISSSQNSHNPQPNSHHFQDSDTTHLAILEEETIVKEVVLSETPRIPKPALSDFPPLMKSPIPSSPESSIDPKRSEKEEQISDIELSLSGVSDFLSFSAIDGVLSTSTATTETMRRESNEEEEVVGPPVYALRKKSFSGDFTGTAGRLVKTRLPEKKSCLVSPAGGYGGPPQRRPVPAELGRRRARSGSTGGAADGDRRSMGKGGAAKTGAPGCRSMDASAVKSRRVVDEPIDDVPGALVESLENPLVSLECFIFL